MLKRLARYGACIALIQGLAACGQSPVANEAKQAEKPVEQAQYDQLVVAFGDSLYAGYQLGPNEGFAPQLQGALGSAGINARVHNAGVSGDTTAAGRQRLTFVLDNLGEKPDLVVLAGFMRILPRSVVDALSPKIINIHPSLLPAFPGAHAVRDALAAGAHVTGATVHIVDNGVDTGPVIAQTEVPIPAGISEAELHDLIREVERKQLIEVVRGIAEGRVKLGEIK